MEETEKPVETIRTLKGDVENMVRDNKVSVVSVVAQEADRTSGAQARANEVAERGNRGRLVLIGIILLVLGIGGSVGAYFLFARPVDTNPNSLVLPNQVVVTTQVRPVTPQEVPELLLEHPSGAIAYVPGEGAVFTALSSQDAFLLLFPNANDRLVRSLGPRYTLLATPQGPALLFEVASYERGYSELLSWERTSLNVNLKHILGTVGTTTSYADAIMLNLDVRTNGDTLYTFQTDKLLILTTEPVLKSIIPLLGGV